MNLDQRCAPVKLIVSDVDGVMTDGRVVLDPQGNELKRFHIRDGLGIKLWQRAGGSFAIVTGRTSTALEARAKELGVEILHQGVSEKMPVVEAIAESQGLAAEQVAAIGDDLPDLPVIRRFGLGIAVADACDELRDEADYVTERLGGSGAVRETIEMIMRSQGRWDSLVKEVFGS